MEADWEFEIGGDAPVIDACWRGFVNLRDEPARVREIRETEMLPGLAEALLQLNREKSPVWTCKTDVFVPEQFDRDELAANSDEAKFSIACYLDVLMGDSQVWPDAGRVEEDCRRLCVQMRQIPLRCCRVDLVIRRARLADSNDLGVTAYLTACGRTLVDARGRLGECLAAFARLMVTES